MTVSPWLDAAGRRRSPATLPGYHAGRPPRMLRRLPKLRLISQRSAYPHIDVDACTEPVEAW